jgi:hypothetical protein
VTSLIVLAAGLGRRFGAAKQLTPVGPSGEALCDYAIFDAIRAGCRSIVVVTRSDLEHAFYQHLAATFPLIATARVAVQPPPPAPRRRPFGTGHALLAAAEMVDGPVVVCNADDWYGPEAFATMLGFLAEAVPASAAVVGYPMGQTLSSAGGVSRALLTADEDGWVQSVEELVEVQRQGDHLVGTDGAGRIRHVPPEAPTSMNLWGFPPEALPVFQSQFVEFLATHPSDEVEFALSTAVGRQLVDGRARLRLLSTSETWCGLTHPNDLVLVRERLAALTAAGRYPPALGPAVRC